MENTRYEYSPIITRKPFKLPNESRVAVWVGVNIEHLLLPICQAGGIALGYNPTEVHRPIFRKYSIPILKGLDLRAFAEIIADRKKITEYCE